jgi:hypothetical protein
MAVIIIVAMSLGLDNYHAFDTYTSNIEIQH